MLIMLLAVCAVSLTLILTRRRHYRQLSVRDVARAQRSGTREQMRLHNSFDALIIQMEETSRRVNAQLDTRFRKLELVIQDADARLAELRRATAESSPPRIAQPARPTPRKARVRSAPRRTPAAARQQLGDSPRNVSTSSPAPSQRASSDPANASAPPDPIAQLRSAVFAASDDGNSAIQIAESLHVALGEVELILNLRDYERDC